MVWITVRIQGDELPIAKDFVVTSYKEEGDGDRLALDADPRAELEELVKDKLPKRSLEELLALREFRVNVVSGAVKKVGDRGSTEGATAKIQHDTKVGTTVGNEAVPEVVIQFAKAFAKKVAAEKVRAKPSVFRGQSDKMTPELWITQFERFAGNRDCFDLVMLLREYLSGVALTWYNSAITMLGSEASWATWRDRFLAAFPSDHLRDAEIASRYMFKEESGSLLEYLFEKQRLLFRANPTASDRSIVKAVLLGLPFYIRQQFKILRSDTMADVMKNVDIISVKTNKRDTPGKASPSKTSPSKQATVNIACIDNGTEEDIDDNPLNE